MFFCKFLHVFKGIFGVIFRVVGHDGGDAYAVALQVFGVVDEALDDGLYVWAMVADKGYDRTFFAFNIIVGECFAVDVFEREIGCG